MSQRFLELIGALSSGAGMHAKAGEETIEVSEPASTAAHFYEKVRTTVDYQEDHLLRRNAIFRIIRRYIGAKTSVEEMVENLLRELIWAKYLPNKEVPVRLIQQLIPVFQKYEPLLRAADQGVQADMAFKWVLDVMATEIEYALAPPYKDEALVSYMYQELRMRTTWDPKIGLSNEERDLYLYIAIHKTLLKSNTATLRFRVMTLYYPDWPGASSPQRIQDVVSHLDHIIQTVEDAIQHPITIKLSLLVRRKAGVFRVLHDAIMADPEAVAAVMDQPDAFDKLIKKTLQARTKTFKSRLRRTVVRAVGFLFLTKMLLALVIELPYDLLIAHETSFMPLAVNILFHPLFLAGIGLSVSISEKHNAENYTKAVRALMLGAELEELAIRVKANNRGTWATIFSVVYALMFLFSYGVIGFVLMHFEFNWLSASLFLFFLSLVTFFGIRIRTSTKDIVLSERSNGIFGTMFDFFLIPVVRAGRWLSVKVSKINIFIYFFDFIIEAPFKVAVRFVESWVKFVREKKEEI